MKQEISRSLYKQDLTTGFYIHEIQEYQMKEDNKTNHKRIVQEPKKFTYLLYCSKSF